MNWKDNNDDRFVLHIASGLYGLSAAQKRSFYSCMSCLPLPFVLVLILSELMAAIGQWGGMLRLMIGTVLAAAGYWLFTVLCVRSSEFILDHQDPVFTLKVLSGFLKNPENRRESRTGDEYIWIGVYMIGGLIAAGLLTAVTMPGQGGIGGLMLFMTRMFGAVIVLACLLPFYMRSLMRVLFKGIINLSVRPEDACTSFTFPDFNTNSLLVGIFTVVMVWLGGDPVSEYAPDPNLMQVFLKILPVAAALYVNLLWCEYFVFCGIRSLRDRTEVRKTEPQKNPWLR